MTYDQPTMKRFLSTLFILLVSVLPSRAQVGLHRNTFAFGGNIGIDHSQISVSPKIKQGMYLGKTFGITARYTSEKYFFLICAAQIEANFVERGWREEIEDGTGNEYNRRLTYVEIPFFAHLGIGREARGVQGFINLGPQIGFLIRDKENYGGMEPWDPSKRPNNVNVQYGKEIDHKLEYGITGGLGIELKTAIGNFIIEGRYYFGLSDIFGNTKTDYFGRSANTSIYAKVAYMFEIR